MNQRSKNHIPPHKTAIPNPARPRHNFAAKVEDPHLQSLRTSPRWIQLRLLILSARPCCVICQRLRPEAPRLAEEIHHIIPAAKMIEAYGDEGFFTLSNLAPLCRHHHQRNESAWKSGTADSIFPPESRLKESELWPE